MGGVKKKSPSLQKASHGFPPFVHPDSTILLLGSFPSVKSREEGFFYAHPQNRFWRLLAGTQIHKILLNGTKASALYEARWSLDLPTVSLFSSSSANAGKSYGELLEQWSQALRPSL